MNFGIKTNFSNMLVFNKKTKLSKIPRFFFFTFLPVGNL
jgi:hypothetical protein